MLISAFFLGLLGSLHCLGMCGPIALALPTSKSNALGKISYNLGRVITYSFLGMLLGTVGMMVNIAGFQRGLSIGVGIMLIGSLLLPREYGLANWSGLSQLTRILKRNLGAQFQKKQNASLLVIGLFNGLLPCGLVYVALAAATTSQNWYQGGLYMALFGLGTIPMMFSISWVKNWLLLTRLRINRMIPVLIFLMGCLFILRGLNLGIPYLSPDLSQPHHHQNSISK